MNDFYNESSLCYSALNDLYGLYPVVIFEHKELASLGRMFRDTETYFTIQVDPYKASLETVHHEYAHIVAILKDKDPHHNSNHEQYMNEIKQYCVAKGEKFYDA